MQHRKNASVRWTFSPSSPFRTIWREKMSQQVHYLYFIMLCDGADLIANWDSPAASDTYQPSC